MYLTFLCDNSSDGVAIVPSLIDQRANTGSNKKGLNEMPPTSRDPSGTNRQDKTLLEGGRISLG
jgi:hypothetical protein